MECSAKTGENVQQVIFEALAVVANKRTIERDKKKLKIMIEEAMQDKQASVALAHYIIDNNVPLAIIETQTEVLSDSKVFVTIVRDIISCLILLLPKHHQTYYSPLWTKLKSWTIYY